jgi:hypothetical protein
MMWLGSVLDNVSDAYTFHYPTAWLTRETLGLRDNLLQTLTTIFTCRKQIVHITNLIR